MKWECPNCHKETAMRFVGTITRVEKCYDYQQEIETRYYACLRCDKYTQRKFVRTTYMACPEAVIAGLNL
jgi:hypothetical protein